MTLRSESTRDGRRGRGPFVRRSELSSAEPESPLAPRTPNRATDCFVRNDTGAERQLFEAVRLSDVLIAPSVNFSHYWQHDLFSGRDFTEEGDARFAVLQQPAEDGGIVRAIYAGVTVVRLTGPTGKTHATPVSGAYALDAADSGPATILHDPGPAAGYDDPYDETGERFAKIRIGGGAGPGTPIVMFTIVQSAFCGACSAIARVLSVPVGGSVPGVFQDPAISGGDLIRIYDKTFPDSCFLNEPPEDLLNRVGFAAWLDAKEDGPCPNTFGPRWHVFSLCCHNENSCS